MLLLKILHFNIYFAQITYRDETVENSILQRYTSVATFPNKLKKPCISNLNRIPQEDMIFSHFSGLYS